MISIQVLFVEKIWKKGHEIDSGLKQWKWSCSRIGLPLRPLQRTWKSLVHLHSLDIVHHKLRYRPDWAHIFFSALSELETEKNILQVWSRALSFPHRPGASESSRRFPSLPASFTSRWVFGSGEFYMSNLYSSQWMNQTSSIQTILFARYC